MQPTQRSQPIERNPQTYLRHRREVFRQITIPLVIAIILVAVPALMITLGGAAGIRTWADVSIIWMIPPMLLFAALFLAANTAIVYLLFRMIRVLPGYTKKAQDFMVVFNQRVRRVSDSLVKPVIKVSTWKAQADTLRGSISRQK